MVILIDGGIGLIVNMKIVLLLDIGNKFVFLGQSNYDEQCGKLLFQVFGLYSVKSGDGMFGGLIVFFYFDCKIEGCCIFIDGFLVNQIVKDSSGNVIIGVLVLIWIEYDINDIYCK